MLMANTKKKNSSSWKERVNQNLEVNQVNLVGTEFVGE